ncbi:diguanylate cyclase, partial [Methylobacterium radiotolerans]
MSTGSEIARAEAVGLESAPSGTPAHAILQEPGTLAAFWRRLRARKSAVAGLVIV